MAKFRSIKNSFLGGQISRTAVGRTDLPQYAHSCELLQNVIPLLSGGAYRRPGSFAQDSLSAVTDEPPRLLPFIVSRNEAYMLSLNVNNDGGYIKSYRRTNLSAGVSISTATGTTPYTASEIGGYSAPLANIDQDTFQVQYAQSNEVMWLVHPKYKPQLVTRTALDTLSVGDFDLGQSGMTLAQMYPYLNENATSATMKLSASSGTGVTMTCSVAFFNSLQIGALFAIQIGTTVSSGAGGMLFVQVTACSGTVNSPSTTCTVKYVVNAPSGFSNSAVYTQWWESAWSNYRGWPSSVAIFQQRLCFGGTLDTVDPLGVARAGSTSIWFSQTANLFKMSALNDPAIAGQTVNLANGQVVTTSGDFVYYRVDDAQGDGQSTGPIGLQPFRVTLADTQEDTIQWLSPDQEILVGTLMQEYIIAPQNGSFDVANSIATIQSHYGSSYIPAVRIGYELMFCLRSQDEVRAYQYNYIDASFFGEPVQLFFDEYPQPELDTLFAGRRKFRQMDWDVTRNTLWCVDTAGNFFGMTRDRKLQITMWHTHQFGGYDPTKGVAQNIGSGDTTRIDPAYYSCDGSVISFASVPNAFTGVNDLWVCVKRTISGNTTWQIEAVLGKNTIRNSAYQVLFPGGNEPGYVDAATIQVDNGDGTLNYAQGTQAIGYPLVGTYYSQQWGLFAISSSVVDDSGNTNLNTPLPADYGTNVAGAAHQFTLGLPYTSIIQPVRIEVMSPVGTAQGAIKRISKAYVRFFKTLMAKCGSPPGQTTSPFGNLATISWAPGASMAQSSEIYTGDKQVFIPAQFDRDGYLYLVQDQPLPWTVVSISMEGEEYEQ